MAKLSISSVLILGVLLACQNTAQAAPTEPAKAIRLTAQGDLYGPVQVSASASCLKVQAKLGYMLWTRDKPDLVREVNPENKTYLIQPAGEWIEKTRSDYPGVLPFDRTETKTVKEAGTTLHKSSCFRKNKDGSEELVLEYFTVPRFTTGAAGEAIWAKALGLSSASEFPVGVSQLCLRGKAHKHRLQAQVNGRSKRWKQLIAPVKVEWFKPDAKTFAIPPAYKQAKDRAALYFSDNGDMKASDIDDLFRSDVK